MAAPAGDADVQDTAPDADIPPALDASQDASDDDDSASATSGDDGPPVESLVAGRARRANAGNLMARALAAEDDGETDLLFVEEGEDDDFEAAPDPDAVAVDDDEDDSSSSSDDDDDQAQDDDLAGEKELRKQERAEKRAAKRKPIGPQPIRKRVKIADPSKPDVSTKRPKKSERVSWLPSEGEAPTRVSSRTLAVENKARTLENLKESSKKTAGFRHRLEITSAQKKAMERPPLTQEERLQEAARTEKLNVKSVKRWEQQESDRQARQKAELERLRNKKLEGPVIRWYSGPCEWDYKDRLYRIGRPQKVEILSEDAEPEAVTKNGSQPDPGTTTKPDADVGAIAEATTDVPMTDAMPPPTDEATHPQPSEQGQSGPSTTQGEVAQKEETLAQVTQPQPESAAETSDEGTTQQNQPAAELEKQSSVPPTAPEPASQQLAGQELNAPESTGQETIALESSGQEPTPAEQTAPENGAGPEVADTQPQAQNAIATNGESVKVETNNPSFLEGIEEYASLLPEAPQATTTTTTTTMTSQDAPATISTKPASASTETGHTGAKASTPPKPAVPKPEPRAGQAQTLTLLSFDANVLNKQPEAVRRILLKSTIPNPSSSTSRSANAIHLAALRPVQPHCAITNLPARYRDPLTGLPYRDMEAFKVLRDTVDGCLFREDDSDATQHATGGTIAKGRYGPRWSTLLGAWVGREGVTARNVPAGFVHGTVAVPLPPSASAPAASPSVGGETSAGPSATVTAGGKGE